METIKGCIYPRDFWREGSKMAAVPATDSPAVASDLIHALATKLKQLSNSGTEGYIRTVSRCLSDGKEKNQSEKTDLECKKGNPIDLTSKVRASSRNKAYSKGRARVYTETRSTSDQIHGRSGFDEHMTGPSTLHAREQTDATHKGRGLYVCDSRAHEQINRWGNRHHALDQKPHENAWVVKGVRSSQRGIFANHGPGLTPHTSGAYINHRAATKQIDRVVNRENGP